METCEICGGVQEFVSWYLKKLIRLYVSLVVAGLITTMIECDNTLGITNIFFSSLNRWYVHAVAILYVLFYITLRFARGKRILVTSIAVGIYTVLYLFAYDKSTFFVEPVIWFRLLYGFVAMIFGSYIRDYYDRKQGDQIEYREVIVYGTAGILSLGAFLLVKLFLNRINFLMQLQCLTQVFGVAFAVFMLLCGCNCENLSKVILDTKLGKLIKHVSKISLEIYLVQFAVISKLEIIVFPINLILIVVTVIAVGSVVHWLSNMISGLLLNGKKSRQ